MSDRKEEIDLRLAEIPGQYYAKRALEVALEGKHSIQFIGSQDSQAWSLINALQELQGTSWYECPHSRAIMPCLCGHAGLGTNTACTCSIEEVTKWRQGLLFNDYAISVVVPDDSPDEIMKLVDIGAFDEMAVRLLRAAVLQLGLSYRQTVETISVAHTIAEMAAHEGVQACHTAEAIQYIGKRD